MLFQWIRIIFYVSFNNVWNDLLKYWDCNYISNNWFNNSCWTLCIKRFIKIFIIKKLVKYQLFKLFKKLFFVKLVIRKHFYSLLNTTSDVMIISHMLKYNGKQIFCLQKFQFTLTIMNHALSGKKTAQLVYVIRRIMREHCII